MRPRRPRLARQDTQSMHDTEILLWKTSNQSWLDSLDEKLRERRRGQNKERNREKRALNNTAEICNAMIDMRGEEEITQGTNGTNMITPNVTSNEPSTISRSTLSTTTHQTVLSEPEPGGGYTRQNQKCWATGCTTILDTGADMFCNACEDLLSQRRILYETKMAQRRKTQLNDTTKLQRTILTPKHSIDREVNPNVKKEPLPSSASRKWYAKLHSIDKEESPNIKKRPLPSSASRKWYANCATPNCPCTASFNGQDNEACGKHCRIHGACKRNHHRYPCQAPKDGDSRQPPTYPTVKHVARMTREEHKRARQTPTLYRASHTGKDAAPRG